jgi:DNA-binding XRE family transcriptional regulator
MFVHGWRMPKPVGNKWRRGRAELDLTSEQVGPILEITAGHLRSIENELQTVSYRVAYRAARLFKCSVDDLIRSDEVPDEPPSKEQEKETNTGPGRDGGAGTGSGTGKGKTGPKRVQGAAA